MITIHTNVSILSQDLCCVRILKGLSLPLKNEVVVSVLAIASVFSFKKINLIIFHIIFYCIKLFIHNKLHAHSVISK